MDVLAVLPPRTGPPPGAVQQPFPSLPAEIWMRIVNNYGLTGADLKSVRLTSRMHRDMATPRLFEKACYSVTVANLHNIKQLLRSNLRHHVNTLVVNTALFGQGAQMSKQEYVREASQHLARNLGLKNDPFLHASLTYALEHKDGIGFPCPQSAAVLRLGYDLYQNAKSFQHDYFERGHCRLDLVHAICNLPNLQKVEISGHWELREIHLQQLKSGASDPASRATAGKDKRREQIGFAIPNDFPMIEQRGSLFAGPGRSAREMNPLHVPPQPLDQSQRPPLSLSIPRHLIEAITECKSRLTEFSMLSTLPTRIFNSTQIPFNPALHAINPLMEVLRPLKKAVLNLSCDYRVMLDEPGWRRLHASLPYAIRSMKDVEDLAITCESSDMRRFDLFKLILEVHLGTDRFWKCHSDYLVPKHNDPRNSTIFRPHEECPGYVRPEDRSPTVCESPYSPRLLRVPDATPWVKLTKLTLCSIHSTKYDLASLLLSVQSTLRDLTLEQITLRDCPCERDRATGLLTPPKPPCEEPDHWYDALTMMNQSLNLNKCLIPWSNKYKLHHTLHEVIPRHHKSIFLWFLQAHDNVLGNFVLTAEGKSFACWLISQPAFEQEIAQNQAFWEEIQGIELPD